MMPIGYVPEPVTLAKAEFRIVKQMKLSFKLFISIKSLNFGRKVPLVALRTLKKNILIFTLLAAVSPSWGVTQSTKSPYDFDLDYSVFYGLGQYHLQAETKDWIFFDQRFDYNSSLYQSVNAGVDLKPKNTTAYFASRLGMLSIDEAEAPDNFIKGKIPGRSSMFLSGHYYDSNHFLEWSVGYFAAVTWSKFVNEDQNGVRKKVDKIGIDQKRSFFLPSFSLVVGPKYLFSMSVKMLTPDIDPHYGWLQLLVSYRLDPQNYLMFGTEHGNTYKFINLDRVFSPNSSVILGYRFKFGQWWVYNKVGFFATQFILLNAGVSFGDRWYWQCGLTTAWK